MTKMNKPKYATIYTVCVYNIRINWPETGQSSTDYVYVYTNGYNMGLADKDMHFNEILHGLYSSLRSGNQDCFI